MTYVLLTLCCFAYGSLVSLHWMRRAALIPGDWVHEEIGDFGPPYEVNDRELAITHAWLAVPFWPVHELVSTMDLLGSLASRLSRAAMRLFEEKCKH